MFLTLVSDRLFIHCCGVENKYAYTLLHTDIYTHYDAYTHVHTHTCSHTCTRTHEQANTHTHTHTHTQSHTCAHVQDIQTSSSERTCSNAPKVLVCWSPSCCWISSRPTCLSLGHRLRVDHNLALHHVELGLPPQEAQTSKHDHAQSQTHVQTRSNTFKHTHTHTHTHTFIHINNAHSVKLQKKKKRQQKQ